MSWLMRILSAEDLSGTFADSIGMVFQNPDNQFVGTTVEDDVAFGLENNGIPCETMVNRVSMTHLKSGNMEFS